MRTGWPTCSGSMMPSRCGPAPASPCRQLGSQPAPRLYASLAVSCSCMQGRMFASTMARATPCIACAEDSLSPGSSGQSSPPQNCPGHQVRADAGPLSPQLFFHHSGAAPPPAAGHQSASSITSGPDFHCLSTLWSCADIMDAFCLQAKQRAMEDMTPGQASTLARNERQIEKIQVRPESDRTQSCGY